MPSTPAIDPRTRSRGIRRVLLTVLLLNVAVALAKFLYGLFSHSVAMEADGIASMFDGVSNIVGLVGMWLAVRPADENHPYGHGKFETFTAATIGVMLVAAGYTVGRGALEKLFGGGQPTEVEVASFAVMVCTLAVNVFVTSWESRVGRRLGSEVLVADARHTLSDVAVSVGVIVSLIFVKVGWGQADGIVALLVAAVIFYTALSVIRGVTRTLGDEARLPAAEVEALTCSVPGVLSCHALRTRGLESQVFVDLHVLVAATQTVDDGHAIAHQVENVLRSHYQQVVDVVVHVEPAPK